MDHSNRRVFITGSGILSGEALNPARLWDFVRTESKAPGKIPGNDVLASMARISAGDASILARHQLMALAVAESAWCSAGLGLERNRLRGEGGKHRLVGFGCVGGSSLGGLSAMEGDLRERPDDRFSPYALSRWRGNAVSSVVALRHGLSGSVLSLNAASATGAQLLWMAGNLIRGRVADAVVAVASDQAVSPKLQRAMERNGSVATRPDSAPLSGSRSGMNPSEGAACLILESEGYVRNRAANVLAEWVGGSCRNESHHLQAPDPDGATLEEMIRDLTNHCRPDWISLHATGTFRYDAVEASVIRRVFGEDLPWITAFKRVTGHALSASGLIEAALLVEGLRAGEVPPAMTGIDESLGLAAGTRSVPLAKTALQIGQGMGGDVVVNLLSSVVD